MNGGAAEEVAANGHSGNHADGQTNGGSGKRSPIPAAGATLTSAATSTSSMSSSKKKRTRDDGKVMRKPSMVDDASDGVLLPLGDGGMFLDSEMDAPSMQPHFAYAPGQQRGPQISEEKLAKASEKAKAMQLRLFALSPQMNARRMSENPLSPPMFNFGSGPLSPRMPQVNSLADSYGSNSSSASGEPNIKRPRLFELPARTLPEAPPPSSAVRIPMLPADYVLPPPQQLPQQLPQQPPQQVISNLVPAPVSAAPAQPRKMVTIALPKLEVRHGPVSAAPPPRPAAPQPMGNMGSRPAPPPPSAASMQARPMQAKPMSGSGSNAPRSVATGPPARPNVPAQPAKVPSAAAPPVKTPSTGGAPKPASSEPKPAAPVPMKTASDDRRNKRVMTDASSMLCQILTHCLDELQRTHPSLDWFWNITRAELPDYFERVRDPIFIKTIRERLRDMEERRGQHFYRSSRDFISDFEKLHANTQLYNADKPNNVHMIDYSMQFLTWIKAYLDRKEVKDQIEMCDAQLAILNHNRI